MLFADHGNKIYLMLREFASEKSLYGWLEFAGVLPVDSEDRFGITEEEIVARKRALRLDAKLYEALKKNIAKNLQGFV